MREIVAAGLSRRSRAVERGFGFGNARRIDQVELGDEDMVGERDLAHGFDMIVERAWAVHRVDGRDHDADAIEPGQHRIGQNA